MYLRYFVLRYYEDCNDKNLLGKYGHRVIDLVNDGYKTKRAADVLCLQKNAVSIRLNKGARYKVVSLVI